VPNQSRHSIIKNCFECFSTNIAAALNAQLPHHQVDTSRLVDSRIGATFASRSLDLEQFSFHYMVNAEDFLQACKSIWS
jgi:hypothetical protein